MRVTRGKEFIRTRRRGLSGLFFHLGRSKQMVKKPKKEKRKQSACNAGAKRIGASHR